MADTLACAVDSEFHTHLLCPSCACETVKGGYYSGWRCAACGDLNAQAVIVCTSRGPQVVDQATPADRS